MLFSTYITQSNGSTEELNAHRSDQLWKVQLPTETIVRHYNLNHYLIVRSIRANPGAQEMFPDMWRGANRLMERWQPAPTLPCVSWQPGEDRGPWGLRTALPGSSEAQHMLGGSTLRAKQSRHGEFSLNLISCQLTPTPDPWLGYWEKKIKNKNKEREREYK